MHDDEGRARLGYRGAITSGPKGAVAKAVSIILGGVVLVSAFVASIAFFAIALAVVLVFGGYLWWKTRDLRRHMREQIQRSVEMQESRGADTRGDVIEGEVISRKETNDHLHH